MMAIRCGNLQAQRYQPKAFYKRSVKKSFAFATFALQPKTHHGICNA
jgi:hypothetical protein